MNEPAKLAGWPHQLREQLSTPDTRRDGTSQRQPSPRPAPAQHEADERRMQAQTFGSLLAGRSARRTFGRRPIADELWRIGTDPYQGTTHIGRHQLSIGCAAGLLAELMLETRPDVIPDRPPRRLLVTYLDAHRVPVLAPDLDLTRHDPPRDPLRYTVLDEIAADSADSRRPLADYIEYLAESAYRRVAERLVRDRYLVESARRRWPSGRRQRVWTAVEPTNSLNAMNRLPRELRAGTPLPAADRVLIGLVNAVDLTRPIGHEYGQKVAWPDRLALPDDLARLVAATGHVVGLVARGHRR